jgi:hypothetical protein
MLDGCDAGTLGIGISAVKDALDTELGAPHQPGG